jgi:carbamoyltransferase
LPGGRIWPFADRPCRQKSLYHQLIPEFCRLTPIPIVLNTSFNENEPAVCRRKEALDCFLRTKMDVMVLGNFWVERN